MGYHSRLNGPQQQAVDELRSLSLLEVRQENLKARRKNLARLLEEYGDGQQRYTYGSAEWLRMERRVDRLQQEQKELLEEEHLLQERCRRMRAALNSLPVEKREALQAMAVETGSRRADGLRRAMGRLYRSRSQVYELFYRAACDYTLALG